MKVKVDIAYIKHEYTDKELKEINKNNKKQEKEKK